MGRDSHILTINSGSSSIKFSLYGLGETEALILKGELAGIGVEGGYFQAEDQAGHQLTAQNLDLPDHDAAWKTLFDWLQGHEIGKDLPAVGHRFVHGGTVHVKPQIVSPTLIEGLKLLMPLAPDYLPHEIKGLEAVHRHYPLLPQVVCFDTAFHRRMLDLAQRSPLPKPLIREGLRRYGFHGLSYEYLTQELTREAGSPGGTGKMIIAHLGNGASMAAIENGRGVDTTMGLTPVGGPGDEHSFGGLGPRGHYLSAPGERHDPGSGKSPDQSSSGALGDIGNQLGYARPPGPRGYPIRRGSGGGDLLLPGQEIYRSPGYGPGLDTFVFTAGIGENSATIRARICANLEFLGIHLDLDLNNENAPIISKKGSPVTVRVMKTNEELMIARHTRDLLGES
jgi:acetate kinase